MNARVGAVRSVPVRRGPLVVFDVFERAAFGPAFFLAANVPIALAVQRSPGLAMAHSLIVLVLGVAWTSLGTRTPDRVAYLAAYIVGCEVLWRMAGSPIGWEFGKYALILVLGIWMAQQKRLRGPTAATAYFALLLPSTVLTFMAVDELEQARQQIAFNLAGPFAVMMSVWFFAQVDLSPRQRRNVYVALIGPAVGIAAITVVATILNPDITFGTESNKQATGGFGPNQVSAMLGLGALVALIGSAEDRADIGFRPLMLTTVVVLAVQSAFTFSRSGLYFAGAAAGIGSLFFLSDARSRVKFIFATAVLASLGYYIVFPWIDDFTGGALGTRFADTDITNRGLIIEAEILVWRDHLFFGVGPGQGNLHRGTYFAESSSHTEYTRMLAEHGLLGLASMVMLAVLVLQTIRKPHTLREKAIMASFFTWSFFFMMSSGMRLAAPAFMIGLACLPSITAPPQARRLRPLRRGTIRPGQTWNASTVGNESPVTALR